MVDEQTWGYNDDVVGVSIRSGMVRFELWPILWIFIALAVGCDDAPHPGIPPESKPNSDRTESLPPGPIENSARESSAQNKQRSANDKPANLVEPGSTKGADSASAKTAVSPEVAPTVPKVDDDSDPYLPRRKLPPLKLVDVPSENLSDFGLRRSQSKHLDLITDLPEAEIPSEFHTVFEQAIGQWGEFFAVDSRRFTEWQVTCFLIVDESKFQRAKLFPGIGHLPQGKLPPGGWQYGNQIWVRHQPGPYYTRHMLLHEATHAFVAFNFGALGPPWLAEGLAEYLAVHRWADGRLQLAARVTNKDELPYWGRVKLIRDAYQSGAPKSLLDVMKLPPSAFPFVESYAWSWAAVSLYANHPQLRAPFLAQIQKLGQMTDTQWNRELLQAVPLNKNQLEAQWQVDTTALHYGHDFERTAIQWRDANVTDQIEYQWTLPADGAWHATGLRLTAGEWEVTAHGSYQLAECDAGPWIAQPDGITIRYAQGAPLGQVQWALQGDPAILQGMSELTKPQAVGSRAVLRSTGEELFLRVNDWPNQLEDNQGQVAIVLRRL